MGTTTQRQRIIVQGIVQGVGFRPFVYGLALRQGLVGFVLNNSQGVLIEVEGESTLLDLFHHGLRNNAPPLARIDNIIVENIPLNHDDTFVIAHSQVDSERRTLISPDTTVCKDCLRELFDMRDRRYGYPFINCTNCGPRFTIIQDVPYDRPQTTMSAFTMCVNCQAEYDDPLNRRFHAQPNACPVCGPHAYLLMWDHISIVEEHHDAIHLAAQKLAEGHILAIKGLGGYHLACDALNPQAVQQLRQRKHREAKPFALMVHDVGVARQFCSVNESEMRALQSHQRPIVLLQQRPKCKIPAAVAPGYITLGIMLPYTPLHYLLLDSFHAHIGPDRAAVLVMTSGNVSDEPIAYLDEDARTRLSSISTGMLTHNRTIYMRCDDTVLRFIGKKTQFFRRSRGYAPEPIQLAHDLSMPILACGGHLKNTFCLGKQRQTFLSHHIGDLENWETLSSFHEGIEHFKKIFDIHPQAIAYDLHPEYLATKYALDSDIPHKVGIQHHHAHIASVLAEHHITERVIGIAADGTGYGTDGAIWGCEIMDADLTSFERTAHLNYIPLPGGDQAIRQPWRSAASHLAHSYGNEAFLELPIPFVQNLDLTKWRPLAQMIERNINSPLTSSLGRLFDAAAALIGLRQEVFYEGQAAIELEIQAQLYNAKTPPKQYPFLLTGSTPIQIDTAPLIRAIVQDIRKGAAISTIAARFHTTIIEMLASACYISGITSGHNKVALSGGVFQNRLLLEGLQTRLKQFNFQVLTNQRVPPNDGGLSLGQLAIAAALLKTIKPA